MTPTADPHRLATLDQVRAIIGDEAPTLRAKLFRELDAHGRAFIAQSPFVMLATSDAEGRPDVSPKGDHAGFVVVEDDQTLLVPDRKGNKLIFSLQNIVANPRVALIFIVPGTEETFRVHGTAELTVDPAVLGRLVARGQPAHLAIRVRVEQCFFHCAKAFKRSALWRHESWPANLRISFGKMMAEKFGGGDELAQSIDAHIAEDYETNL